MAFSKRERAPSRTHGPANSDYYYDNDEDDEYVPVHKAPAKDKSCLGNKRAAPGNGASANGFPAAAFGFPAAHNLAAAASKPNANGKSRPTNNQLLYKAFVRWPHYTHPLVQGTDGLPVETETCASVTAALLQVLQILHSAEMLRQTAAKRNVLQILSANTRRTKVVELSSSTHRVPDELRKHYISDGEGGQYSTNLDRNKYGNDENYLFTVIKYDLEYLSLCPCLVDVEITDVKAGNSSLLVATGWEFCTCGKDPRAGAAGGPMGRHHGHGTPAKDALNYSRGLAQVPQHIHNTAMNAIAAPAAAFAQNAPKADYILPQYQEHQAHPHAQQLQQLQQQPALPQLQQQLAQQLLQQQQLGFVPQAHPQPDHGLLMQHPDGLLPTHGQLLQQQQLLASLPPLQQQHAAQQQALAASHQLAHQQHAHHLASQQQQHLDTTVKEEDVLLMPTRAHMAGVGAAAGVALVVPAAGAQTAASVLSGGRLSRGGRSASSGGAMGIGGGHNAHLMPAQPALSTGRSSSPRHSGSTSQLFDALVMAAAGISVDSGHGLINRNGCTAGQHNHRNGLVPNTAGICTRPGEQPQVTSGVHPAQLPPHRPTNQPTSHRGTGLTTPEGGNRQLGPTISSVLSGLTDMERLLGNGGLTQSQDGGMGMELGNWADDSSLAGLCAGLDTNSTGLLFSTRAGESSFGLRPPSPSATAAAAAAGGPRPGQQQPRPHSSSLGLQMQHKSRLCSIGTPSVGEMDSLQNALQAFRETDENESREEPGLKGVGGWGSAGVGTEGSVGSAEGGRATTSTASLRQRERRRKPDRGASGSAGGKERPVLGRSAESAPQPSLLRETSDENKAAGLPGKAAASVEGQELVPVGHVMNTRTHSGVGGHKRSAGWNGGTEEDAEAEMGPDDMDAEDNVPAGKGSLYTVQQHKRQHRNPPRRQSSVAAMSTRAMPYEQAKLLTAELEQLHADNVELRKQLANRTPSVAGATTDKTTTPTGAVRTGGETAAHSILNGNSSTTNSSRKASDPMGTPGAGEEGALVELATAAGGWGVGDALGSAAAAAAAAASAAAGQGHGRKPADESRRRTMEQELAALKSELASQASARRHQEAAAAHEAAALKAQLAAQAAACRSAEEAATSAAANLKAAKLQMDAIMQQIQNQQNQAGDAGSNADDNRIQMDAILQGWSSQADEAAAAASLAALAAAAAAAAAAASPVVTQTSASRADMEWQAAPLPDLNLTPPAPLNSNTNPPPSSNNSLNMLPWLGGADNNAAPQPMTSVVNSSSMAPALRGDTASGLLLPQPQQQQRHLTQHELQQQHQLQLQAGLQHVTSGSGFYFGSPANNNNHNGVGRGAGGQQLATSYAGLAGGSQQHGWLSQHQQLLHQQHDPQQHFPTHSHHSPLTQAHSFAPWVTGPHPDVDGGAPPHHNAPPVHCHSRGAASQADIGFGGQDVCGPLPTHHPSSAPADAAASGAVPPHRNSSPQDCLSDSGSGAGGYWYAGNHGSSGNSHPTPEAMAASRAAHLAATMHPSSWHALQQQSRHPSQQNLHQNHHAANHQHHSQQQLQQQAEDEQLEEQQGSD